MACLEIYCMMGVRCAMKQITMFSIAQIYTTPLAPVIEPHLSEVFFTNKIIRGLAGLEGILSARKLED